MGRLDPEEAEKRRDYAAMEILIGLAVGFRVEVYVAGDEAGYWYQVRPACSRCEEYDQFYSEFYVRHYEIDYRTPDESAVAFIEAYQRWKAGDLRVRDGWYLMHDREEAERRRLEVDPDGSP